VELDAAETRWCAGLPCTGEVPLGEAQRALVMRVYQKERTRTAAFALLALALLPASALVSLWLRSAFGKDSAVPIAFSIMLFFFGLPWTVAKLLGHLRVALPLRRDLANGVLQTFAGTIARARYEEEDPDVVALVDAGSLVRGEGEQVLGVLPVSARLLHVNGRDVLPERRLHIAVTAATRAHALRYSLPPDVKQAFGMQRGLKRRRFGEAERHELGKHIARLTAIPWMLVVLTAFVAITVSSWVVHGVSSSQELLQLGWIVAWAIVAVRHVRAYLLARRFEDDLEVGWLLSWETPDATDSARSTGAAGASASPGVLGMPFASAEVLPISQMDWMIDGKPAAWRRVIQRAAS
jgi:hypothetical protein